MLSHGGPDRLRQGCGESRRSASREGGRSALRTFQYSNAMGFRIGHIEHAAAVHGKAVRPRQAAFQRIGFGTISSLTRAKYRRDDAGRDINFTNDMIFSI